MGAAEDSLRLLTRIAEGIDKLVAITQKNPANAGGAIATDQDLDSRWGDEEVRFTPRDWAGAPMKGKKMSQCPPEFLDLLADAFDYFARQAEEKHEMTESGKPVAAFKKKSAARARGWALRLRTGWKGATPSAGGGGSEWGDDNAPRW